MLQLRRLFYSKLGQLSRERNTILSQQPESNHPEPFQLDFKYTAERDDEAEAFTNKLCANRAEESRTYIFSGTCFLCVSGCILLSVWHHLSQHQGLLLD